MDFVHALVNIATWEGVVPQPLVLICSTLFSKREGDEDMWVFCIWIVSLLTRGKGKIKSRGSAKVSWVERPSKLVCTEMARESGRIINRKKMSHRIGSSWQWLRWEAWDPSKNPLQNSFLPVFTHLSSFFSSSSLPFSSSSSSGFKHYQILRFSVQSGLCFGWKSLQLLRLYDPDSLICSLINQCFREKWKKINKKKKKKQKKAQW